MTMPLSSGIFPISWPYSHLFSHYFQHFEMLFRHCSSLPSSSSSSSLFLILHRPFHRSNSSALGPDPAPFPSPSPPSMRAWAIHAYNTPLVNVPDHPIPRIRRADNQLLIRVMASSINPIDVAMCRGYGREVLGTLKCVDSTLGSWIFPPSPTRILETLDRMRRGGKVREMEEGEERVFPLVPGRDCSGEVVEVGVGVKNFQVGDQVIAVIPAHWPGSLAQFVVAPTLGTAPKPASLTHAQAASLPYVSCTAWAALVTMGRVKPNRARGLRALIHGGAGGVGTVAIQILRAWGADKVVATCSAQKMDLVRELGAVPVDYQSEETAKQQLLAEGPFELILDCADSELAAWSDHLLGIWRRCVHISVNSSLLRDTDRYGLPMGVAVTGAKLLCRNVAGPLQKGSVYLPAFFTPDSDCLNWVSTAAQRGELRPVIDQTFAFEDVPKAFEKVGQLHGKGKTVIEF